MIKANVIIDHFKWKNKIKDPNSYFKKKLRKFSKIPKFQRKKQEYPQKGLLLLKQTESNLMQKKKS